MKVLMACAGINIELRPFTDMMPKCLLPIKGKSILFHNLDWLQKYDIDEVVVTASYHANQIEIALRKYQSSFNVRFHRERTVIGTAQSLRNVEGTFSKGDFLFLHGDNLYNFDIDDYYKVHKNSGKSISILSHMTKEDSRNKSFIKYKNDSDEIEKISVKPDYKITKDLLATSGVCYMNPEIVDGITKRDKQVFDHVIPKNLDNINVIVDNNSVEFINNKKKFMAISNTWKSYDWLLR